MHCLVLITYRGAAFAIILYFLFSVLRLCVYLYLVEETNWELLGKELVFLVIPF